MKTVITLLKQRFCHLHFSRTYTLLYVNRLRTYCRYIFYHQLRLLFKQRAITLRKPNKDLWAQTLLLDHQNTLKRKTRESKLESLRDFSQPPLMNMGEYFLKSNFRYHGSAKLTFANYEQASTQCCFSMAINITCVLIQKWTKMDEKHCLFSSPEGNVSPALRVGWSGPRRL